MELQWDDGANNQMIQWAAGSVVDDNASTVSTSIMNRNMDDSKWQGSMWNNNGKAMLTVPNDASPRPALSTQSSTTEFDM